MNFEGNFSKPDCTNAGSIKSFSWVPVEDVASMNINFFDLILQSIALNGGAAWRIGYSTIEKIDVSHDQVDSENGDLFRSALTGFMPGYNYYLEKLFTHMAASRHIVDVVDNNDERYVLGTMDNGMRFQWKYDSGDSPKKLNGYSFRFYHDSHLPRLRYNEGVAVPMPELF